jgi:GxxExxY protein
MNLETRKPGEEIQSRTLTEVIIGAAIRVHRDLGPGFLESVYEEALALELTHVGLNFERQKLLPIFYREHVVGEHRLDILVERQVILELKAIADLENIHFAILRSYLKAADLTDGLLLNFASPRLTIKRVGREYNPSSNKDDS